VVLHSELRRGSCLTWLTDNEMFAARGGGEELRWWHKSEVEGVGARVSQAASHIALLFIKDMSKSLLVYYSTFVLNKPFDQPFNPQGISGRLLVLTYIQRSIVIKAGSSESLGPRDQPRHAK
jgi:hypothetical protein